METRGGSRSSGDEGRPRGGGAVNNNTDLYTAEFIRQVPPPAALQAPPLAWMFPHVPVGVKESDRQPAAAATQTPTTQHVQKQPAAAATQTPTTQHVQKQPAAAATQTPTTQHVQKQPAACCYTNTNYTTCPETTCCGCTNTNYTTCPETTCC